MDTNLTGKRALVCGSSRGIGKAIAIELALLGADVTVLARSEDKLQELSMSLATDNSQKHDYLAVDMSDTEAMVKAVQQHSSGRPYHILINNSGGPPGGPILQADPEEFLLAYQRHLIASHRLVQALSGEMKEAGYGRIVNIISTSVKTPIPGLGVSNTTRGAVASWAKTLAGELAPHSITVNNILPGFTRTERIEEIVNNRAQKAQVDTTAIENKMKASVPMGRFADASEVAAVAAFLCTPAAAYVTGTSIRVDGGRTPSI